jgi:hypothetical protein
MCSAACQKVHAEKIGKSGHRMSWQLAAFAVEDATLPLLGENLDLSRRISFEDDQEYVKSADDATVAQFRF